MEFRRAYDPLRAIVAPGSSVSAAGDALARRPAPLPDRSVVSGGIRFEGGRAQWIGAWLLGVAFTVCFCIGVAVWVVGCLVHVGLAGAVRRLADGAKGSEVPVSELFRPRGLLPSMIVARLCKAVLLELVALPFLVMYYGPYWLGSWVDVDIPGLVSTRVLGAIAGGLFSLAYLPIFATSRSGSRWWKRSSPSTPSAQSRRIPLTFSHSLCPLIVPSRNFTLLPQHNLHFSNISTYFNHHPYPISSYNIHSS
jgi:hypothetical protein